MRVRVVPGAGMAAAIAIAAVIITSTRQPHSAHGGGSAGVAAVGRAAAAAAHAGRGIQAPRGGAGVAALGYCVTVVYVSARTPVLSGSPRRARLVELVLIVSIHVISTHDAVCVVRPVVTASGLFAGVEFGCSRGADQISRDGGGMMRGLGY